MELLSAFQRDLLVAVGQSELRQQVYFTGGTLLAGHYLRHRKSLDLDFFSDELLDDLFVAGQVKEIASRAGVSHIKYTRYPSRSQYFLTRGKDELKFDIAYFPFPKIGRRVRLAEFDLAADSLRDIAVNKVHACFERDAPRDTFDLYMIMKKMRWTLNVLLKDVQRKFGTEIDLVHLVARLMAAIDKLDEVRPLFVGRPPDATELRQFFKNQANRHLRSTLSS